MPTGATVRVVSNRLPSIPGALKAAVSAEVSKAALQIEAQAKAKVPVRTGTLQRSIHAAINGLTATVGPSVDYGIYIEFGSRGRGPRPYMRPAAEAVAPTFVAGVRAALARL